MSRRFRVSPALVVASLALLVSLGGTAFAGPVAQVAATISGSRITPHSIAGNRLKSNTLTGTQVKESTLSTVPSAASAAHATNADGATHATWSDTATRATTADFTQHASLADNAGTAGVALEAGRVDGMLPQRVLYLPGSASATPATIYSASGLTLTATCSGDIVAIIATTSVDHAHFQSAIESVAGDDSVRVPDFNQSTTGTDLTGNDDSGETTFTYTQPGGAIVSGQLSFDDASTGANLFNHTAHCLVSGIVTSAPVSAVATSG